MKIISKFNDYYDSAQMFYSDDVIFVRKDNGGVLESGKSLHYLNPNSTARFLSRLINFLSRQFENQHKLDISSRLTTNIEFVGVCGKLYIRVKYDYSNKDGEQTEVSYHTFDDAFSMLKSSHKLWWHEDLINMFPVVENRLSAYFQEYNTPLFVVCEADIFNRKNRCEIVLDTAPNLKELGFFKIQDTYTIYQNIEMFLTNNLTKHDNPDQITDNDVLRDAKGFDKMSFKKYPTKKRK